MMDRPGGRIRPRKHWWTLLLFMAGMLVSSIGRNAYFVCMTWIALTWSDSVRLVTALLFMSTLAQFLSSGLSGYLADMFDRRRLSVSLDAVRAMIVALTGYAIAAEMGIWVLFLSVAIYSVVDRGYLTAMQSMIPELSRQKSAIAANSSSYLMMQVGALLGALLAGSLLNLLSFGNAVSSITFIFVTSAIILCFARTELQNRIDIASPNATRLQGIIPIKQLARNGLIAPTVCNGLTVCVATLLNSLLAAYVLREMKGDAVLFSQMESAWAFGSALVCLLLSVGIGKTLLGLGLAPLLFLSGVGLTLLWTFPSPVVGTTTLVALGVIYNVTRILMDVRVQQTVSTTARGRTKGAINTVATGIGLLIYALMGIAGETFAPSDIFAQYGFLIIAVAAAFLLVESRDRLRLRDKDGSA